MRITHSPARWLVVGLLLSCGADPETASERAHGSSGGGGSSGGSTAGTAGATWTPPDAASATGGVAGSAGGALGGGGGFVAGAGGAVGGGAGAPSEPDGGEVEQWMWSKSWPGVFFEGTSAVPAARFDLPIPGGATIRRLEMKYSVDIGQVVAGTRHQFSFTCADAAHPYAGGVFGFLFLNDKLGNYVFRNGRPGEGATAPTKIPFSGLASTKVEVALRWDAVAGTARIEVTDHLGGVSGVTSKEKVEPTPVTKAVTVFFGFDTLSMPNPAESASIGWKYHDLELRAAP